MAGKPPLSREEVERILRCFEPLSAERRIILVGGQAVAFWMRFLAPLQEGVLEGEWLASKDIDFEGSARAARRAGQLIDGSVALATIDEPHTPNTGVVTFIDSEGHKREIDFIDAPFGLSARDVRDTAVRYVLPSADGGRSLSFWIMHPERCMESRVCNTVNLHKTGTLALRQLKASITCARLWSRYLLESRDIEAERRVRAVLNLNERVFRRFMTDRRFRDVLLDHGADPFSAVLAVHPLLPDRFAETRYPQMCAQVEERLGKDRRNRARAAARRTAG